MLSSAGSETSTEPRSWICTTSFTYVPASRPPSDHSNPGSASAIVSTAAATSARSVRENRVGASSPPGLQPSPIAISTTVIVAIDQGACRPRSASADRRRRQGAEPRHQPCGVQLERAQPRR